MSETNIGHTHETDMERITRLKEKITKISDQISESGDEVAMERAVAALALILSDQKRYQAVKSRANK